MAEPVRTSRPARRRQKPAELAGLRPVSTIRLPDELAGRIRALIISDKIAEGARLPSERELAERFGASRPTVSQALRSLSLMGLVEIRHGSGAYVVRRPEVMVTASVNLMLDLDRQSVDHLMQLRLWLEGIGTREAATRQPVLSGAETEALQAASRRLRDAAGRTSELIAADTIFHATIVRSGGNPYLGAMYESVHSAVLSYQLKGWVDSESEPPWLRDTGLEQHWALHEPIVAAVIDRNIQAAEAAVLKHHHVMAKHLQAARAANEPS
jgi:GntR family transcriptional regulator, transcriptional repressor for pyruvate dehydrogenase complex